jgi:hypothetical protein
MGFLNKQKISKTVIYYVSEVLIVIVGIFIAIQLNNWNENEKNKEDAINSLKRIKTDLNTEKFVLEDFKKDFNNSRNYLINVAYNNNMSNLDSISQHFEAFIHYKMNSEYINLKYSGKLNLITNDKLRYNLVNYYEVYYAVYEEISEFHKTFINGRVEDYFLNEFPSDTTSLLNSEIVKLKLKDKMFQNLIKEQISSINFLNDNVKTERIDSLTKWIDFELK